MFVSVGGTYLEYHTIKQAFWPIRNLNRYRSSTNRESSAQSDLPNKEYLSYSWLYKKDRTNVTMLASGNTITRYALSTENKAEFYNEKANKETIDELNSRILLKRPLAISSVLFDEAFNSSFFSVRSSTKLFMVHNMWWLRWRILIIVRHSTSTTRIIL